MKQTLLKILFASFLLAGCSNLKPVPTEYKLIRTFSNTPRLFEYGKGKILIYNAAGLNHKVDDTSRLNIWINGRSLGQLQANQYAILFLMPDTYEFKLQHKDIGNFESSHTIKIDINTSVISMKPTISSNKVEITNSMPENFQIYKNVIN